MRFFLNVTRLDQSCIFQLSWGKSQSLQVVLAYPQTLTTLYTDWRTTYSQFYRHLRGRVDDSGGGNLPPEDWRVKLAQAEVLLLNEFYFWLSDAALLPIRSTIAKAAHDSPETPVDVFLTCDPIDLERLPWESWEIGAEFAATQTIRVTRSPINIRHPNTGNDRQGRTRILAILGDETGLNFQTEIEALKGLDRHRVAEVTFVGWQNQRDHDIKSAIVQKLGEEQGWDILFFAGHSNETVAGHGEIQIAPNQSMLLKELLPHLKQAQKQGLQVAIFNSCSGLSIAQGLIDLGLSQVVVMREPIHNQVAQEFFLQFVKRLANYDDIHTAIRSACQALRLEKSLTFPSAYLIPSLYRHPEAKLFRARPIGLKAKLRQWQPTRLEAIGLLGLIVLTTPVTTQQHLINQRQRIQALYRDITRQVDTQATPPVLLVSIDTESIEADQITPVKPMDKGYLSRLLNHTRTLKAPIVGLDYLLDRFQPAVDTTFNQTVEQLVQQGTWLTVATARGADGQWLKPANSLVSDRRAFLADMDLRSHPNLPSFYAPLRLSEPAFLPLSYQLALTQQVAPQMSNWLSQRGSTTSRLNTDLLEKLRSQPSLSEYRFMPPQARSLPITRLAYKLQQMWLHPVIDYSLPPNQIYQKISATRFLRLSANSPELKHLSDQILFIVPGLYDEAGVKSDGEDHYVMPEALRYWQKSSPTQKMPGGEVHAYLIHHWLRRSLITPIPDLWMILLAALFSKGLLICYPNLMRSKRGYLGLGAALIGGSWISLQCYVGYQILVPWLSSVTTICFYLASPIMKKQWYAAKH